MDDDRATLGKASLGTAILGIVLPGCLAVLVAVFIKNEYERRIPYVICGLLFVVLEFVAFGCGIGGKRTATGKAGLIISTVLLLIPIVCAAVIFFSDSVKVSPKATRPAPIEQAPDGPKAAPLEGAK
jgi:hypothetical protein